ncbi:zinc finger BED domain-containing protein RICESLEEPER 1-like [Rosa chinensis]|uniref:zinc finger BED domain-containing protein RICESLEEPER 1-like n=1 Tax=Rosa chinensis TaxID=74649 RepID=UPI000D0894C7|nr:zinc finger BED domain-containing protein RICESLEEPER 1-like [Rosa chinensis]
MADEEDARYRSYFDEDEELDDENIEAETQVRPRQARKRVGAPVQADWDKASVFVKFLKVFYDVTISVSAQLHPTSNEAFHDIVTVKAELDELFHKPIDSDSSESDKVLFGMANKMRAKYKKYFGSLDDINELFFVALVLDPRYKLKNFDYVCETMLYIGSEEIKRRSDEVKQLVLDLCDLYATSNSDQIASKRKRSVGEVPSSKPTPIVPTGELTRKRAAMLDLWNKQLEGEAVVVRREVDRYLLDPIEKPQDNENWKILDWWRVNGSKYPNLQAVARDVLAIQVSTVASESSFSTGKRVIDPHRSSLTPRIVGAQSASKIGSNLMQ